MPTKKAISHDAPGVVIHNSWTLQNTEPGHYKYYYLYVYGHPGHTDIYMEKKWGRIGSPKGSTSITAYPNKTAARSGYSKAQREAQGLIRSKKDKGYKEVDLKKLGKQAVEPPTEIVGNSLSRFRDM